MFKIIALEVEVVQMLDTSLTNMIYIRNEFNNVCTQIICNTAFIFSLIMEHDVSCNFLKNESVGRLFAHYRIDFLSEIDTNNIDKYQFIRSLYTFSLIVPADAETCLIFHILLLKH